MVSLGNVDVLRNVFEMDNARNQYERQLPQTFVPTQIYWRLFSPKNQILVGTRGSGKTAILKMLSLPYLQHLEDEYARDLIRGRHYIGVYIPATTLWLGPIKSRQWRNTEEKGREFLWHFSIAACQSLTKTIESIFSVYYPEVGQRLTLYSEMMTRLTRLWFPDDSSMGAVGSLRELRDSLGQLPLEKNLFESSEYLNPFSSGDRKYAGGARFYSPALDPFLHAVRIVQDVLELDEASTSWLICMDEVETLDEECQVVINSFMRSDFGNRYFKIATLPYAHKTLRTNLDAPLQVGNDFEYLWIDDDPASHENSLRGAVGDYSSWTFARLLYNRRRESAGGAYARYSLDQLFGKTSLLAPVEWLREKIEASSDAEVFKVFQRLAKSHFNEPTLDRSIRLIRSNVARSSSGIDINSEVGDQLVRKTLGFLLLRDAVSQRRGREKLDVYSGAEMLVRIADGNARTLIRLLNSMLRDGSWRNSRARPLVPRARQHEIFTRFSKAVVERTRSEEHAGPALHGLLTQVGRSLHHRFHTGKVGSDLIGQFKVSEEDFARHRSELELGIQLGLIRVDLRPGTDFTLPTHGGTLRLSYLLSPAFELMPRRGRPAQFLTLMGGRNIAHAHYNFGPPT